MIKAVAHAKAKGWISLKPAEPTGRPEGWPKQRKFTDAQRRQRNLERVKLWKLKNNNKTNLLTETI